MAAVSSPRVSKCPRGATSCVTGQTHPKAKQPYQFYHHTNSIPLLLSQNARHVRQVDKRRAKGATLPGTRSVKLPTPAMDKFLDQISTSWLLQDASRTPRKSKTIKCLCGTQILYLSQIPGLPIRNVTDDASRMLKFR